MPLIGKRFVQSRDPGAVGFGYQWQNSTTGELHERNTTNTKWVYQYNVSQENGGIIPTTGCRVTGHITGVSGYASEDGHNFPTSLTLGGDAVATVEYVDKTLSDYYDAVDSKTASNVNGNAIDILDGILSGLAVGVRMHDSISGEVVSYLGGSPTVLFSDSSYAVPNANYKSLAVFPPVYNVDGTPEIAQLDECNMLMTPLMSERNMTDYKIEEEPQYGLTSTILSYHTQ